MEGTPRDDRPDLATGEVAGFESEDGPDEPNDERRRRNRRLLLALCAGGAILALAIGIAGVVLVRGYLDDATSPDAKVSAKYQREYRHCVLNGGAQRTCADRAERHCLADPHWARATGDDDALLGELASACLVGPDRSG